MDRGAEAGREEGVAGGCRPSCCAFGPYEFRFYAPDRGEPPHVHVRRGRDEAKIWLGTLEFARNHSFDAAEQRVIERIVEEHAEEWLRNWHEYFAS
jgi:hypothetical protein